MVVIILDVHYEIRMDLEEKTKKPIKNKKIIKVRAINLFVIKKTIEKTVKVQRKVDQENKVEEVD